MNHMHAIEFNFAWYKHYIFDHKNINKKAMAYYMYLIYDINVAAHGLVLNGTKSSAVTKLSYQLQI